MGFEEVTRPIQGGGSELMGAATECGTQSVEKLPPLHYNFPDAPQPTGKGWGFI